MASERARPRAPPFIDPPGYERHRPEATLLYQLVERHYPEFAAVREAAGRPLPKYLQEEFEAYLKCGRLEHGFLRVRCEDCHAEKLVAFSCKRRGFCPSCGARRMTDSAALLADEVLPAKPIRQWVLSLPFALRFLLATNPEALTRVLGIVYRTISGHLFKKAGLTGATGATGAVTLIQRFGSALNLNIHLHMLVLDGAYLVNTEPPVFRRIAPPREAELKTLVERLAERIGRALERQGVLARDAENTYLELAPEGGGPMDDLLGHSITYRVAVGPRSGQKVFSLQSVPARADEPRKGVAQYAGFSLHAGIGVEAEQRGKLERLTRYVSRPPVALERLDLTTQGQVRYRMKTPYRDGTTHLVLEPLDFIARLAALVPPPRVHLTRFHGVFAAHAGLRAAITPGGRGAGARKRAARESPTPKDMRATTQPAVTDYQHLMVALAGTSIPEFVDVDVTFTLASSFVDNSTLAATSPYAASAISSLLVGEASTYTTSGPVGIGRIFAALDATVIAGRDISGNVTANESLVGATQTIRLRPNADYWVQMMARSVTFFFQFGSSDPAQDYAGLDLSFSAFADPTFALNAAWAAANPDLAANVAISRQFNGMPVSVPEPGTALLLMTSLVLLLLSRVRFAR